MKRHEHRMPAVFCFSILFLLSNAAWAGADWLAGWNYRVPVTVNNGGDPLADYTVRVSLNEANIPFEHAAPGGADLRLTAGDGTTLLSHWTESWDPAAGTAEVWGRLPDIGSGEQRLYVYYGNAAAPDTSDGRETFLFFDGFENGTFRMNADQPLVTPSYDGSGHMVHPDVVYVPEGWGSPGAYPYWMLVTPYPWGNDDYENPSILASHDGIRWEVPPGLVNPLAPNPADGHHCDTDALLVGNELFAYYILGGTSVQTSYVQLMRSPDGVNWTGPQTVLTAPDYLVSPTFLSLGEEVHMWYVDSPGCSSPTSTVHRRVSPDGINWGPEEDAAMPLPGQVIWHFDIQKTPGGYAMVVAAYPEGRNCGASSLYFAESADGMTWTVDPRPLLSPNPFGWDNACIYRSTFLMEGDDLSIWYSARNGDGSWRVGYTEGALETFWSQQQISVWDSGHGAMGFTGTHARSGAYGLEALGGTVSPQLFKNLSGTYCAHAWIYDDRAVTPSLMALLRLWDHGNPSYPLHAIGAGIWQGSSETHYTTHTEGWNYTPTDRERTAGWHKLSLCNRGTSCDLLVDGSRVRSLDVLDEQDIRGISLDAYHGGTSWFDDVHVHPVANPEPETAAGAEQVPPWTAGTASTVSGAGIPTERSLQMNVEACFFVPLFLLLIRRRLERGRLAGR